MKLKIQGSRVRKPEIIELGGPYSHITLVTSSKDSLSVYIGDKLTSTVTLQDKSLNIERLTSISLNSYNLLSLTTEDKKILVFSVHVTKEENVTMNLIFKSATPNITTASLLTNTDSNPIVVLGDLNGGVSIMKYTKETKETTTTIFDQTLTETNKLIPNKANAKFIQCLYQDNETMKFVTCSDDCLLKIYEYKLNEDKVTVLKNIETGFFFGVEHFLLLSGHGVDSDYCAMSSGNEYSVVNLDTSEILINEKFFREDKEAETDESFFENGISDNKDKEPNNVMWLKKDDSESVVYGKLETGELFNYEIK